MGPGQVVLWDQRSAVIQYLFYDASESIRDSTSPCYWDNETWRIPYCLCSGWPGMAVQTFCSLPIARAQFGCVRYLPVTVRPILMSESLPPAATCYQTTRNSSLPTLMASSNSGTWCLQPAKSPYQVACVSHPAHSSSFWESNTHPSSWPVWCREWCTPRLGDQPRRRWCRQRYQECAGVGGYRRYRARVQPQQWEGGLPPGHSDRRTVSDSDPLAVSDSDPRTVSDSHSDQYFWSALFSAIEELWLPWRRCWRRGMLSRECVSLFEVTLNGFHYFCSVTLAMRCLLFVLQSPSSLRRYEYWCDIYFRCQTADLSTYHKEQPGLSEPPCIYLVSVYYDEWWCAATAKTSFQGSNFPIVDFLSL